MADGRPGVRDEIVPAPRGFCARLWGRICIRPLIGDERFVSRRARRECPHCQNLLPAEIEHMGDIVIGLVGGSGSGKSHYIASLIHVLDQQGALRPVGGRRFRPADDSVRSRYITKFYNTLFRDRTPIPRTSAIEPPVPLIYTMIYGDGDAERPKRVSIVLYDAAGENLQTADKMVLDTRYVLSAKALIFLVDPMQIDGIWESLADHLRPRAEDRQSYEAFRILDDVYEVCRSIRGLKDGEQLNIPIAIAMSKADTLKYSKPIDDMNPTFVQDPFGDGTFRHEEMNRISKEVEQILRAFEAPALDQAAQFFSSVSYHAVSATGHAVSDDGHFPDVEPMRCADPVVALLRRLGIITDSGPVEDDEPDTAVDRDQHVDGYDAPDDGRGADPPGRRPAPGADTDERPLPPQPEQAGRGRHGWPRGTWHAEEDDHQKVATADVDAQRFPERHETGRNNHRADDRPRRPASTDDRPTPPPFPGAPAEDYR